MKIIQLFLLIALFTSCSSKPDIERTETILSEQISNESNGKVSLVSIEKTNAVENEFMGQKSYTIQYKAQVEILENCFMYVNKSGSGSFFQSFKTYEVEPEFIPSLQMQIVKCTKGNKVDFNGSMLFLDTENGWVKMN